MNSQSDQIRALLEEIDELMHGGSNSFIWRFSGDRARHRQTLEHLRSYLNKLNYALKARSDQNDLPILLRSDSPNPFAIDEYDEYDDAGPLAPAEAAAQDEATELEVRPFGYQDSEGLLEQLSLELTQLRESLLGPLQQEVEQLRQERSTLQEEVTQLKIERAENGPLREDLLHQFLETLVGRLQERMVKQVSQILQEALPRIIASQTAALPSAEMEEVQQLQRRANGLLSNLDSTLQVFSQTLEQNIQAYQQSLSVGLERMHSMGREGEVMMSSLVNRLAEQMEHQTELYLKPSTTPAAIPFAEVPSEQSLNHILSQAVAQAATTPSIPVSSRGIAHSPQTHNISSNDLSAPPLPTRETSEKRDISVLNQSVRPALTDELDALYADFGEEAAPPSTEAVTQAEAVTPAPTTPYQSLEEALFDGIPESESAWAAAWNEGEVGEEGRAETDQSHVASEQTASAQAASDLPPEAHIIHSLTDLVSRTFQDLEGLNRPAEQLPEKRRTQSSQTALLEPPSQTVQPSAKAVPIKKKKSAHSRPQRSIQQKTFQQKVIQPKTAKRRTAKTNSQSPPSGRRPAPTALPA